uniref:Uncharacterized protein n=1 Tax=Lotharella globosa TaxID=91324 RepID=A0A6V3LSD2_9EUKA
MVDAKGRPGVAASFSSSDYGEDKGWSMSSPLRYAGLTGIAPILNQARTSHRSPLHFGEPSFEKKTKSVAFSVEPLEFEEVDFEPTTVVSSLPSGVSHLKLNVESVRNLKIVPTIKVCCDFPSLATFFPPHSKSHRVERCSLEPNEPLNVKCSNCVPLPNFSEDQSSPPQIQTQKRAKRKERFRHYCQKVVFCAEAAKPSPAPFFFFQYEEAEDCPITKTEHRGPRPRPGEKAAAWEAQVKKACVERHWRETAHHGFYAEFPLDVRVHF